MQGTKGLACPRCGREVVPRLWHYGGGRLTYMKIQHLCPFCGVVMYETGGGVRRGCWVLLAIFGLLFAAQLAFILYFRFARALGW